MNESGPRERTVRDIFLEALDAAGPDRAALVSGRCGGDADLERAVQALLGAYEGAGAFLSLPAASAGPQVGQWVGPYRLLEKIGEGGFGLVYMAEQEAPIRRRVAVKVLKPGMDSRRVIARFEAERQALAMMDHPSIARVLDAGETGEGRPYFVMELVRGLPITAYCDENRLTTRERLELMAPVCRAVQHAHTKGVVHRDLKPGNVLVTLHDGRPVPKVIDFGIAKALDQPLTDRTLFTEFRAFVGTPAYMSPEQAEMSGLDVDTRSDVYSLGVLIYELITGTPPLDAERLMRAGLGEMQRIIRDETPEKPSTRVGAMGARSTGVAERRGTDPARLGRVLRGDVDWIVMRAMEKDRRRRYETAESLAADLERHLGGLPVMAGPPGAGYRLRRFVSRNRGAVAAALVVAGALAAGFGLSVWGFWRASSERDRARGAEAEQTRLAGRYDGARRLAEGRAARSRAAAEVAQVGAEFIDWGLGFAGPAFGGEEDVRHRTMPELVDLCAGRVGAVYGGKPRLLAAAHYHLGRMYTALGRVEDAGRELSRAVALWDEQGPPDEATLVAAFSELEFAEYQRDQGPRRGNELRERKFAAVMACLAAESSRFAVPLAAWGRAAMTFPWGDDEEVDRARDAVLLAWREGPPPKDSEELLLVVDAMCTPVSKVAIEGRSHAVREAGLAFAREIDAYCPEQFTRNVECLFMAMGLVGALDTDAQQPARLALCDRLLSANLGSVSRDHWARAYAGFYKGRTLAWMGRREEGEALMKEHSAAIRRARGMSDAYAADAFRVLLLYARWSGRWSVLGSFETDTGLPLAVEVTAMVRAMGTPGFEPAVRRAAAGLRGLPGPEARVLLPVLAVPVLVAWDEWLLDETAGGVILDAMLEVDPGEDRRARLAHAHLQVARGDGLAYAGEAARGEAMVREALGTLEDLLGERNWAVHAARSLLGGCCIRQGRVEEGEALVTPAYAWLARCVGPDFPPTLAALRRACRAWAGTGREARIADEMDAWRRRAERGEDPEPARDAARQAGWEIARREGLEPATYARLESGMRELGGRTGHWLDRELADIAAWRLGRAAEVVEDQRALNRAQVRRRGVRDPLVPLVLAAMLKDLGDAEGARAALAEALAAEAAPGARAVSSDWEDFRDQVRARVEGGGPRR